MSSNNAETKPHSAEYFGEFRDFWWNPDFLELMASRLKLAHVKSVLDVGCGIGHWGQILAPFLNENAQLIGVDREEEWVKKATERAVVLGLANKCKYQQSDATKLPFNEGSFDLVTCQTVLIHLKDPKGGLKEMLRVLKPGGTILAVEPNNFANRAVASNLTELLSVDEVMERMKFELIIERGKQAVGLGFNSVGDFIPGYLSELGVENISVYLSDKTVPFYAPYAPKEQQVNIQQIKDWASRGFVGWDRDELLSYYTAGGGTDGKFDYYLGLLTKDTQETVKAIENGSLHSAGGGITYLISGKKQK